MRLPIFCVFACCLGVVSSTLNAQTQAEGDADLRRQVAALRDAVIQQTRQIDSLTAEIERLGIALGQRRPATPGPAAPTAPAATESAPVVNTSPAVPAAVAPTPDPNVLTHEVVKGDNLTNISKKYGTTVEAIQKLNKITDARKMQVGQILAIPSTPPAVVPSPTPRP